MAARAPKPGTTANSNLAKARKKAKRSGFRVTIGLDVWTLHTADIGPGDDFLVRRQTGVPLSVFLTSDSFGLDSVAVIVWTARRKAGEKRLTFQRVLEEMPSFAEIDELTENDEFLLERLEDDDEETEAVDVIDVEEVVPDPLSSGES